MLKQSLVLSILIVSTTYAQNIDSLGSILQYHTITDTVRVNALNKAAYLFFTTDLEKTLQYATEADSLSQILSYRIGEAEAIRLKGIYYEEKSEFSKAMEFYERALQIFSEEGHKEGMANSFNNKGIIFRVQGDSPRSMEFFQKSLKLYDEINDKSGIANIYNNIGILFHDQSDFPQALEYYKKSLQIAQDLRDTSGMANSYINIGIILQEEKKYDEALNHYQKSLEISEKLGDNSGIIINCINTGFLHSSLGEYSKAKTFFARGLKISQEMGSKSLQAWNYYGLGSMALSQKKTDEAYAYSKKAFVLSSETGEIEINRESAEILSRSYAALGSYKDAYEYHLIFKKMSDSILNEKNTKKTLELAYEYQYEKEREIAKLEEEKKAALFKEEIKREKNIRNSVIVGLILVLFVLVLLYYNFEQKRKTNRLLTASKNEIEEKNEELLQVSEEIRAQNENLEKVYAEIMEQKDLLEKSHFQITESINYAKLIQTAVLPTPEFASMLLPEHFILFKPCEIVSGDFYFIKQLRQFTLIAAADCTGHGVPGAFMSMLGVAFLNEIVRHSEIQTSAEVLTELRNKIKQSLQQSGEKGEQRDGMDIAFCAINIETLELSFSGAHNPCWIFRDNKSTQNHRELIILEGDRTPVGVSTNEIPFTEHVVQLKKGDTLYLFSDGYHTQFGGEKNEKYQTKRLKALLAQIQGKDMQTQKQILDAEFERWKGENLQTDDVLVVGVQI